jgi:DNA polymerase sigma
MLIPDHLMQNMLTYLEAIALKLKGSPFEKVTLIKNVKVPLIRVQIGDEDDFRSLHKLDITVLNHNSNTNCRQHTEYINSILQVYPNIKPLFLIIKKLTRSCIMYDTSKQAIRTHALFTMFVIFMPEVPHDEELG